MGQDSVQIRVLANRGYGIAKPKTALPNHPPLVCVPLLSTRLKSATWLLYSLLVSIQSLTVAPYCSAFYMLLSNTDLK